MLIHALLFAAGLVAGFVDAIAGGGGLLALPTLMLTGIGTSMAIGTNKGQGVFGTAISLTRYYHSPLLDRRRALLSFPAALVGAAGGAMLVSQIAQKVLTPLVLVLLAAVAIFMIVHRQPVVPPLPRRRSAALAMLVAFVLAFYDGFFGPGTGTFLILAYALLWHDPLDAASANAKVANFASNLAAMIAFAAKGLIVWQYALPMAAGQLIGGFLGAHLTIRVGRQLVRYAVIAVSIAMLLRLAWNLIRPVG